MPNTKTVVPYSGTPEQEAQLKAVIDRFYANDAVLHGNCYDSSALTVGRCSYLHIYHTILQGA